MPGADHNRTLQGRPYALTTAERLLAHVVRLAGEIGDRNVFRPGALEAAAEYIVGQWSSFGYRVNRQEYRVKDITCANLEVERPGFDPTGGILLIGAHYDSVLACPAADDNGSGVAALLELARRFAEVEPARTVRFVAFANEECCSGSRPPDAGRRFEHLGQPTEQLCA
jgi:acetylornithine deacetylase/succinyl-diaminopimelate desuccinylase-like protein